LLKVDKSSKSCKKDAKNCKELQNLCYKFLHMQHTPYPAAHVPELVPPSCEHSVVVKHVPLYDVPEQGVFGNLKKQKMRLTG